MIAINMKKIDYKKDLKHLYIPPVKGIKIIDVPKMNFLMIDGKGDPNTSQEFQEAVEALYVFSYTIKFKVKKSDRKIDYRVAPLEGLWWVPDMKDFSIERKKDWFWTIMIMQPAIVTKSDVEKAKEIIKAKKNPPALERVRFDSFKEGKCAQVLYIGVYKDEGETIARIHNFIDQSGYKLSGKHHEIYLSDMRKTAPEKLRTILRQPIIKKQGRSLPN